MLNSISRLDCITSAYNNSQSSILLDTSTIEVSPYVTQNIMSCHMVRSDIYKKHNTLNYNNIDRRCWKFNIYMTGNFGVSSPELFVIAIGIREKMNRK